MNWGMIREVFSGFPTEVQIGLVLFAAIIMIVVVLYAKGKAGGFMQHQDFARHYGFKPNYGTVEWRRAGVREVLREDLTKLEEFERDLEEHNGVAKEARGLETVVNGLNAAQMKQLAVDNQRAHIRHGIELALAYGMGNTNPIDGTNPIIDSGLRDKLPEDLIEEFGEIRLKRQFSGPARMMPSATS